MKVESKGLIRAKWESYRRAVMPASAGDVQKQETRRAFYAGAASLLEIISRLGEETVPENDGVETLESLREEIRQAEEVARMAIEDQKHMRPILTELTRTQRRTGKIGRNEPCGCGSGQKFKRCCMLRRFTPNG